MINPQLNVIFLVSLFAFALTGCPKLARMEVYNNTPTVLTLEGPDLERGITITSGQTARFEFGHQYFKVRSGLGTLNYPRNIPFPGEYGPYYNGTLRIQVDPGGDLCSEEWRNPSFVGFS